MKAKYTFTEINVTVRRLTDVENRERRILTFNKQRRALQNLEDFQLFRIQFNDYNHIIIGCNSIGVDLLLRLKDKSLFIALKDISLFSLKPLSNLINSN